MITDPKKLRRALGVKSSKLFDIETNKFFQPLPKPKNPNDWLLNNKESPQTFYKFQKEAPSIDKKRNVLYILPIGEGVINSKEHSFLYGEPHPPDLNLLREYVEIFFTSPKIKCVKLLPHLKLYNEEEKNEYQKKRTRSSRRRKFKQESNMYILQEHKDGTKEMKPIRYRRGLDHDEIQLCIDDLLDVLPSMIPVDAYCLMGIVMQDLFKEPEDLFVAGWADYRAGVFSFARYDPYFLEKKKNCTYETHLIEFPKGKISNEKFEEGKKLTLLRSMKTLTHEILHELGFDHCLYFKCLMNGSGHLYEDDEAPLHLCPICLRKLSYSLECNLIERYKKLMEFYKKISFHQDAKWVSDMLEYINSSDEELQNKSIKRNMEEKIVKNKKRKIK